MKKLILLLAFVAISYSITFSQGCLPEGIVFTTQEQIDNFQANYPGCTEIEGDVLIGSLSGNFNIMNLQGLNNIIKINGRLDIVGCHSIGDLEGLNSLTQVGDYLQINNCTELDNLSGLNSLTQVSGGFVVASNNMLTSVQALLSLSEIGGEFWIGNNVSLTSLEGLNNLIALDSSIKINGNSNLADISALENIDPNSIQTYIAIMNNFNLSNCAIQSICDYLENPTGLIFISSNAPGCNSKTEVEAACLTSVEDINAKEEITIFPNPATNYITITLQKDLLIEEAIIYNPLGQKTLAAKLVNNTMDVSKLKPGMYFIEVATKEWRDRTKLIIE
jgi:hypothetical protein